MLSTDSAAGLAQSYAALTERTIAENDEEARLREELAKLQTEKKALNDEIAEGNDLIERSNEEIDSATGALELYAEENEEAAESQEELSDEIKLTQEELDALEKAYDDAKAEARESVDAQIGLFDELTMKSEMSAQEIVDNWNSQKAAFDNYSANLQKAVDMELDEALVRQLADGSEQSMVIFNELVNGTEVSVDEINAAFRDRLNAREVVAEEIAGLSGIIEAEGNEMYSAAYVGGKNTAVGWAKGISDNAYRVYNATANVAAIPAKKYGQVNQIKSPSRVMTKQGEYTVDGVVLGVERKIRDFEAAMGSLADAGQMAFMNERLTAAEMHPTYMEIPGVTTNNRTSTTNFGGQVFNIYQQPGESGEELAYRVLDIMQSEYARQEVSLGG